MKDESEVPAAGAGDVASLRDQFRPFSRIVRRGLTLNQSNLLFTGIPLGWAGVVGSAVSFLFGGAILLAFLRLYQRRIVLPTDRRIRAIAMAFAFYFVAEAISGLVNNDGWVTWRQVAKGLPFLGFAFVYARLSLSRRADVLGVVEIGAVAGAFAMVAVVAVEMGFFHHLRAEGMAGNPGVLAVIASLSYGICLLAATRRQGAMKGIALAAALCAAATLLLTGMRALWPFLLIGPVIPLAVLRPRLDWSRIRKGALMAAVPLLAVAYLTHGMVETRVGELVTGVENVEAGDYSGSIGTRVVLWKGALEQIRENPLLGSGPAFLKTHRSQSLGFSHYHNFLLNTMVRSGVLGVLAILGLFAVPLWVLVPRVSDDVGRAGLALLLSIYAAFLLSGSVGIMLGHDIHDTIFIHGTIVASFLIAGRQTVPRQERV